MSRIQEAYGYYDSDPRVHGPDDYNAFEDAIKKAQSVGYDIIRDFKIGDTVLARECDAESNPIDDHPIATVIVEYYSHAPWDSDDSNKDYFKSNGIEYLFYGLPKQPMSNNSLQQLINEHDLTPQLEKKIVKQAKILQANIKEYNKTIDVARALRDVEATRYAELQSAFENKDVEAIESILNQIESQ